MAPTALSPSRAADFMQCPLLYRFRVVDRLPEAPSPAAVRGTVVHAVLERLFDLPAPERTLDCRPRAAGPAVGAGARRGAGARHGLFDDDEAALAGWLTGAEELLERWFDLEDPTRLEPAERELYVETTLDDGLQLRGYVDRLDVAPDGRMRVVDYKTGPGALAAVRGQGAVPDEVLRARAVAAARAACPRCCSWSTWATARCCGTPPTRRDLLATERKVKALWAAIERAARDRRLAGLPGQAVRLVRPPRPLPGLRRHAATAARRRRWSGCAGPWRPRYP